MGVEKERKDIMDKGYIYGIGAGILATTVVLLLSGKRNGDAHEPDNLELAGVPDQLDEEKENLEQLENAKMVSEGSQFGVKYYNEAKEEKEELLGSDKT